MERRTAERVWIVGARAGSPLVISLHNLQRVREPGHRMFRTPTRGAHVHVCGWGDEADRARYADAKRQLARTSWTDMNHYSDAKSDVLGQILDRARAWRATGGGLLPR